RQPSSSVEGTGHGHVAAVRLRIKRSPQTGMVASIRIPWGTTVIGNGAILRPAESETNLIEMAPRTTLSGLTVDTQNGLISQGAITVYPGGTDITISDV